MLEKPILLIEFFVKTFNQFTDQLYTEEKKDILKAIDGSRKNIHKH